MKKIIIILITFILVFKALAADAPVSPAGLHGKITDKNGEPVIGAGIYFPDLKTGTKTKDGSPNQFGRL